MGQPQLSIQVYTDDDACWRLSCEAATVEAGMAFAGMLKDICEASEERDAGEGLDEIYHPDLNRLYDD